MLAARGEVPRALELLARASTPEALLLTADLAASVGELPRAIGAIERVLARQIDTPGARERHARWVEALGGGRKPTRHLDEATVVTSRTTQGPYRLLREVARGGAGTVYEAEDELLGRRIAFKVYHGEGADRAAVEREIRLFAKLTGRGVARVFDADPSQGWMALEWIPRGSLRDLLRVGRTEDLVPLERWARPLAVALARVHREGLVHGDVKPANVLLREADDPVLTDFGITRPAGEAQAGGSAGYLSPERLARAPASPLDDVYGFGRIVEDVLERCVDPRAAYWREVVVACVGPASHRPMDGAQLSALLGADAGLPRSSAA
jgi:serine/threonine-protein kinase